MNARLRVFVLGALLAGCGLKGTPPQPRPGAPVRDLRVEGVEGAVRISFKGGSTVLNEKVTAFDVLRRIEGEDRDWFQRIGTLTSDSERRYYFEDAQVVPGKSYRYRVRARIPENADAADYRYSGPEGVFEWHEPPKPPAGTKAVPRHLGAHLSWEKVEGVDGYRVYELDASGKAKPDPANRGLIEKHSWVAVALTNGQQVCYVVRSVRLPEALARARDANVLRPDDDIEAPSAAEVGDAAAQGISIPQENAGKKIQEALSDLAGEGSMPGTESASSEKMCVIPGRMAAPAPPKRMKVAVIPEGVSLTWNESPSEEVVGYYIERREVDAKGQPVDPNPLTGGWKQITETPLQKIGFVDRDVRTGARYEYRARSVDAAGGWGEPSSATKPIEYKP